MSGVSNTGFTAKTIEEILTDIETQQLADIDPALDVSPQTPLGQINAIFAQQLATLWEVASTAYNGFNPNAAEGFLLRALAALTGTLLIPPGPSKVRCTVNLDAATTLPAGSVANIAGDPTTRFESSEDVTSTTAGNYSVQFQSQANGPIVANAGTLTVITAPVLGWNSVTNALDATLGTLGDTDTTLRIRREAELSASGADTVDAIRADLLRIDGVLQAFVFENINDFIDSNGLPPHSFEGVVFDGVVPAVTDATIGQVIWDSKPTGIQSFGNTPVNVLDSSGNTRTVYFSRATSLPVYFEFDIVTDDTFPTNGITLVKDAVALKADLVLNLGVDVISLVYKAAALSVQGVVDVTALRLDFTASPTNTANLTVNGRQIAVVDTTRILVNGL